MTNEKNKTEEMEEIKDEVETQAETAEETAEETVCDTGKETDEKRALVILQKEAEELKKQLAEASDRHLRLAAEYENFKRRTQKEKDDLYAAAKSDVINTLLPVIDNMERAGQCKDFEQLSEGVGMVLSQFIASLEKIGVTEIDALDKPFDPNLHNAVLHDTDENLPENTVVAVLQKGYIAGDRVIRHALVKVVN